MSTLPYSINPDRSKPWNDLPDLPIKEECYRTIEVVEQLGHSKAALGRLQGRSVAIPNQGVLINSISLQEAKDSSAIENIFTTDDELYQAFSDIHEEEEKGPAKEVLRYREALWSGLDHLRQVQLFSLDYFIHIYRIIKQTKDGLRPPFAQVYIRRGGSGPAAGKPFYTPPRGKDILERKLANLIDFINDDQKYRLDPLLKMAIAHFQFEAIHPFRDGNGRAGRIFNIHLLTQKELLDYPILYLSSYIMDHKNEYYDSLADVSQKGNWQKWLLYMLKAVEVTANLTYLKINDILSASEAITQAIASDTEIRRPEQLVQMIFTQPYTKVKHLTDQGIYAENTARAYLNQLVEMGVCEKKVIQGHHYYLNLELYRILTS